MDRRIWLPEDGLRAPPREDRAINRLTRPQFFMRNKGSGGGASAVWTFTANTVPSEGILQTATWDTQALESDDDTNHDDPLRVRFGPTPKYRAATRCNGFVAALAGRTITAAKVRLYKESAADLDWELHRILRNWTKLGVRWSEYAAGVAWGTVGAANATDVSTTLTATFTSTGAAAGYLTFTSAQLLTDVQNFVTGANVNNGWMLDTTVDSGGNSISPEWDTDGNRPELIVTSSP